MTSVHLRHVCVPGSGDDQLLADVDLDVEEGTTLAVVSPSAATRAALLRAVAGLERTATGEISFGDDDVSAEDPRGRDVSVVFADHALYPHRDVLDNLTASATVRKGTDTEALAEQVEQVVEQLALSELLDLRPADLTDEQQQRVALGRALVREARLYLFEEPFAAQAERVRPHVRSVVQQWQVERGRTSLVATASVSEALAMADLIAVLHRGRVHQVGTAREVYARPSDLFVASYLGMPPMNLLPGLVHEGRVETPVGTVALSQAQIDGVGDRRTVIVGVRPEHCLDATRGGVDVSGGFDGTTRVDEVEWRGDTQLAFLGFEVEPEVDEALEAIEEFYGFDLFQHFLVVRIDAGGELEAGMSMHVVVPPEHVSLFDAQTGANLAVVD
ncbi:ABC transporter, ATP-binding protein [Aeromicrobium marinum DSM 15272]|uniref:ABC transporter, ATP-binding protein n=1 Tax=Aeromicrobium marinum DSM 15272 TaxID=585531 RepID=E2SBH0_9ACTN|nr:ABC transporter ATP-binding protein [Aeromicrobium marinum]EFQ83716.1 ABC transporter, ATP-binding protein [Aeromicrobium marinum DSM 15272]